MNDYSSELTTQQTRVLCASLLTIIHGTKEDVDLASKATAIKMWALEFDALSNTELKDLLEVCSMVLSPSKSPIVPTQTNMQS